MALFLNLLGAMEPLPKIIVMSYILIIENT
jgi:hypothetical protein